MTDSDIHRIIRSIVGGQLNRETQGEIKPPRPAGRGGARVQVA